MFFLYWYPLIGFIGFFATADEKNAFFLVPRLRLSLNVGCRLKALMKKVTDGQRYCRHHFGLVSFVPFEARV
jgi:hypothetical protein